VGIGTENVMLGNFWNCHFLFSNVYVFFFLIVRNLKARRVKIKHYYYNTFFFV
jgi:hypothetical protein